MRKHILLSIITVINLSIFISCGSNSSKDTGKDAAIIEEEVHAAPNIATLTEEQMNSIGIELGLIEPKQLTASLKTNGVLKVPNQNKASIHSIYSGVIKSLLVQPGNLVKKGQTIATVSNPDFIRIQSEYLDVRSKITLAELEVKRQRDLNAGNAGALKNLQSAETTLRTLLTAKSSLEQQIRLMGINPVRLSNGKLVDVIAVQSPISGVISNVSVKMGSYIDVSTPVAEVVDNSQLHLDLFVYEKDLPKLKNNQVIHFNITNNPGKEYDAKIFSLGSSFEGDSKAVSVHAMVEGDKAGLIDGMNATAVISLNQLTVPAVPSNAIVTVEGQDYIFVRINQKDTIAGRSAMKGTAAKKTISFERIPVAKGTTDVGYTEITLLKEISNNAQIVVKGAFFVSAKMTNTEGNEE